MAALGPSARVLTTALCFALTIGGPAAAADGEAAADAAFQRGKAAQQQRDFAAARAAYLEAWRIKRTYYVAGNLAQVELELGEQAAAAEHFDWALQNGVHPDARPALQAGLQRAKERVLTVELRGVEPGATLHVDGSMRDGPVGERLYLAPGKHHLRLELADHTPSERVARGEAGETVAVRFDLEPIETAAPKATGTPSATAPSDAGSGAPAPPKSPPSNDGLKLPVVIGSAALSAIGLGMFIGFSVDANDASDAIDTRTRQIEQQFPQGFCPTADSAPICAEQRNDLDRRDQSRTLSWVGAGGFVLFGAASVATWLLWPKAEERRVRAVPVVGPGFAGGALGGRF